MKFKFNIAGLISKFSPKAPERGLEAFFDVKEDQFIQKDGYDVRITADCDDPELSSFCVMEERTRDGVLDCMGQPSILYVNKFTGQTYRREFYKDGKLHRDDGPAIIEGDLNCLKLSWYQEGEIHRDDDRPACVHSIPEKNIIIAEVWYVNGKRHREHGPVEINYCPHTGKKSLESWWLNDQVHRIGGPQETYWDVKTGKIIDASYAEFGKRIRPEDSSHLTL